MLVDSKRLARALTVGWLAALMVAGGAAAQITTDCNTIGSTFHCQSSAPPTSLGAGIDWNLLGAPRDYVGDSMRSYEQGRAIAAERAAQRAEWEARRLAQEQLELDQARERRLAREQADAEARQAGERDNQIALNGAVARLASAAEQGRCDQVRTSPLPPIETIGATAYGTLSAARDKYCPTAVARSK